MKYCWNAVFYSISFRYKFLLELLKYDFVNNLTKSKACFWGLKERTMKSTLKRI